MRLLGAGQLSPQSSIRCIIAIWILATTGVSALSQQYCSNQNTGSDYSAVSNSYQSNGACSTTCSGYALAVVQGTSCWCSNYIPAQQGSTSSCNVACPGYPFEKCGDQSQGLYGYVALGPSPSGTQGGPAPSSANQPSGSPTAQAVSTRTPLIATSGSPSSLSVDSPSSVQGPVSPTLATSTPSQHITVAITPVMTHVLTSFVQDSSPNQGTVTVQATVTTHPSVSVSSIFVTPTTPSPSIVPVTVSVQSATPTTTSTPTTPTSTLSTSTTFSSSPWSPTPWTSIETVTGQVKTLTITPTAPPAAVHTVVTAEKVTNGGFWASPGKVAGVFVAVAFIIIAIAVAIIWACVRQKRRNAEILPVPSTAGDDTPQRRPSRLSQMGLLGSAGTLNQTQKDRTPPTITTTGWGLGNTNSAEKSPADTLDRRSSNPRIVDQRLEPAALWNPIHDNGSHISVRSFRDDQDYSRRMLRIANPDDP